MRQPSEQLPGCSRGKVLTMAVTVYALNGKQFGIVDDVIRAMFADYEDLGRFLRMKLDIKLADIVQPSGLRKAAPDVIDDALERGYVPKLLATLWRESDSAKLKGVIDTFGICIDDYPAAAARELLGMEAVAANLVMRDVIVGYRPDIIKLCSLAARLGGLMHLHDKVDDVRSRVHVPLEAIRARMPALAAKELTHLHQTLLRYQTDIEAKFAEVKIADEVSSLVDELVPAQLELLFASRNWPAEPEINAVVMRLSTFTIVYPAQLNAKMKETANRIGELDFHGKLAELKTKTITITIADAKTLSDFVDDIDRLDAGLVIMGGRVAAHNRWREIEDLIGVLINFLGDPIDDARIFWDVLARRLGEVDKPPEDLAAARDAAVAAFAAQDPQAIYYAVERLQAIIHNHFTIIGVELFADAAYVSQLGDGLQKVLEKLDG